MYKESVIQITQDVHYFNGCPFYTYTFEWVGSKYDPAFVSKLFFERTKDTSLKQLPWPVKIIEDDLDFGRSMIVVRKDVGWHLWWIFVYIKRKAFNNRPVKHFKWRILMTLEIWGLAYNPEGEVTSWRNIGRKRKNGR